MRFKEKLNSRRTVFGPFSKSSDPGILEVLGYAGFDFVIIDLEHGPNNALNAQDLIRATLLAGAFPIIRIAKNAPEEIGKALDIGAMGIQVPQICTSEDASRAVEAAKFAPKGMRGVCRFVRAAQYSNKDRFSYFEEANETLIILQLEGVEAIQNFEEIISISNIDVIFIGPYDLSQALGVSGQINHPMVRQKMLHIIEGCNKRNIKTGVFTDNMDDALEWKKIGIDYISYSVDMGIMLEACKSLINRFQNE